ncbi:ABC transporter permease [Propioniciclava tarda]|uniref:ABC transporter permease n=1 Tax=Propioniciclava tarda TaxID=433330 RepID=A0A4Q9KMD6_PROTD|nr:ABC transporter permease [Propioniciclava tarda]SMO46310.1 nucleoside ABC transporter membrane protein [Propioniciclava tarda]
MSQQRPTSTLARFQSFLVPVLALVVAFTIGGILISLQGVNPFLAYKSLFSSAWFTSDGLLRTLQKTTPLILTGLAVAIPLKIGLFNIGAQGQLILGGLMTAWIGYSLNLPGILLIPLSILGGIFFGALWAWVAGILKAKRNVHEVISTIMLNSIAAGLVDFFISGPMKEPDQSIPRTPQIHSGAMLPNLGFIPIGFPVAIALAIAVWWMLKRTVLGFQFITVGENSHAARYAGIDIAKTIMLGMVLAGGLAGLGGAIETMGVTHRYESGFNAGLGFDGITIALLARGNPLGTIPAAILVATLRAGAASLQFDTGIQPEVVDMLLAITLLLVSIPILSGLLGKKSSEPPAVTPVSKEEVPA